MPCHIVRTRPMTLREVKLAGGFPLGGWMDRRARRRPGESFAQVDARLSAEEDREERTTIIDPGPGPAFMCGEDLEPAVPCSLCGFASENLCDHPMGRGRTCDLALCDVCAHQIGDDLHLCELHFREFQKKCGADRINPWPPRK